MSTFLPAQALRTSKKTGGLNSRPSCVRDAVVCLLSLSRFVSRFGQATRVLTTVSKLALRSSREACSARAAALARRRRRELCGDCCMWGHCYLHGPSHQGSHPRLSPWLRPSANVSRLEAPFLLLREASWRTSKRAQSRCGKLNESVGPPMSVSEACPPVIRGTPQTTTTRERPVCYSKTY